MSTTRAPRRVTSLVGAIVMLLPVFPVSVAMAEGKGDPNRPIEVTFTKWVTGNVFVPDAFGITEGAPSHEGLHWG